MAIFRFREVIKMDAAPDEISWKLQFAPLNWGKYLIAGVDVPNSSANLITEEIHIKLGNLYPTFSATNQIKCIQTDAKSPQASIDKMVGARGIPSND